MTPVKQWKGRIQKAELHYLRYVLALVAQFQVGFQAYRESVYSY
jgi:hypothetical protein